MNTTMIFCKNCGTAYANWADKCPICKFKKEVEK